MNYNLKLVGAQFEILKCVSCFQMIKD